MLQISYKNRKVIKSEPEPKNKRIRHKKEPEPKDIGIYAICCHSTKSVYIGQSKNIPIRLRQHKHALKRGAKSDNFPDWQKDYDLYGDAGFKFEMVFNCDLDKLLQWETSYIKTYKAQGWKLYNNQELTAERTFVNCPKEMKITLEKIIKMVDNGLINLEQLENAVGNMEFY